MITMNLEGKQRELSGVMSALWATRDWEQMAEDEVEAFHAPLECLPRCYDAVLKDRIKIAAEWGWDLEALEHELSRRVSAKWLYNIHHFFNYPTQQRRFQ